MQHQSGDTIMTKATTKATPKGAAKRRRTDAQKAVGWEAPVEASMETDPRGTLAHEAGAKLDAGKLRPQLVLGNFPRALEAIVKIGTDGAAKYSDNGWKSVPDGIARYAEAGGRHKLERDKGNLYDKTSHSLHMAHEAWNLLAQLELILLEAEDISS